MPRCWAHTMLLAVIAALGIATMLAGCGQKGPLYLPEDRDAGEQQSTR